MARESERSVKMKETSMRPPQSAHSDARRIRRTNTCSRDLMTACVNQMIQARNRLVDLARFSHQANLGLL